MPKKSKGAATTRKQLKRNPEKPMRGELKAEEHFSLARPDQQAGGPDHHGLDGDEDRNP
jgi:hypothetical protein